MRLLTAAEGKKEDFFMAAIVGVAAAGLVTASAPVDKH